MGILALMNQDKSVRPEEIRAVMRCISNSSSSMNDGQGAFVRRSLDKVMTCGAVARLLKVSCKRVVALAEKGLIARVATSGNGETLGYLQRSVLKYRDRQVA